MKNKLFIYKSINKFKNLYNPKNLQTPKWTANLEFDSMKGFSIFNKGDIVRVTFTNINCFHQTVYGKIIYEKKSERTRIFCIFNKHDATKHTFLIETPTIRDVEILSHEENE